MARGKSLSTKEWVVGYYHRDRDFNANIIHTQGNNDFFITPVDPETVGLKVPFINLFVDDIVTVNGGIRGRVKFGEHFLGEENGLEFNAYGFFVESFKWDDTTINYSINEDGCKFEKIGNVHDNPEIQLKWEGKE